MRGPKECSASKRALQWVSIIVIITLAGCIVQSGEPTSSGYGATLEALESLLSAQSTEVAAQATMISYLATRGPGSMVRSPDPSPTHYYPVFGSVIIEDDRCCAGGIAGETIELSAHFEASSPFGEITHMRLHSGFGLPRTDQLPPSVPWEPYVESREFTTDVPLNWVGFFVAVQFRDAAGNLSPVIWDEIAIEGMLPPTPE
jgi:hypothetical protein